MRLGWDSKILVEGLSFDAAPNSWTCLLGESGVGKSTLLRTFAGLVHPISGSVFEGTDSETVIGRVAYMAQQDLLLPWLTATENVALGARLRRETPDLAKVTDLLHRTGISDRADARPGELSGGERQRAAVARALITRPQLVLADEPTGNLDAGNGEHVLKLMLELNQELRTSLVIVTHDHAIAGRMDRVLVLERGRLRPADSSDV